MTRDAFKTYYESTHAPLAAGVMARCMKYVRNFVTDELTGPLGFDVVTEFWFDVEGPWQEAMSSLTDAAKRRLLEEDEARFMDRSSMQIFLVDEREMDPARLLGGTGGSDPR
jgi:uncharacterized protein (TIGR02118 family)